MCDIRDNPAMSSFEMPLGDGALAVYKVEDGRVALLHAGVPQELSGLGYGSRLAHGVSKRCDAMSTPRRLIEYRWAFDGRSAFGRRYLTPIECMSKGNF